MLLDIPCIIFAGGKSSRMKRDKSLLPFANYKSLTHYQYEKLSKIFKKVYISTKDSSKFDFEAKFIIDKYNDLYAPTNGFLSIYNFLHEESFFVIGVDLPFIDKDIILKIYNEDSNKFDATIARTNNSLESLCGIYHKSLENKFKEMLKNDNHKLQYMLKNSNIKEVFFKDILKFKNLNYFNEYLDALKKIKN